jgi:hypothetical protein
VSCASRVRGADRIERTTTVTAGCDQLTT